MIKKLRIKFIVLSMLAVLVLLAVVVAAMNITNYNSVVREADEILTVLSENQGSFPQFGKKKEDLHGEPAPLIRSDDDSLYEEAAERKSNENAADDNDDNSNDINAADDNDDNSNDSNAAGDNDYNSNDINAADENGYGSNGSGGNGLNLDQQGSSHNDDTDDYIQYQMNEIDGRPEPPDDMEDGFLFGNQKMSPETPYESRFFSILLDQDGTVQQTDISRIKAVDEDTAAEYAQSVFQTGKEKGFFNNYRFISSEEENGTRIIFLDYGRKLDASNHFMLISILMAICGYAAFFVVIVLFSKRMIRPVVDSYEKQKRFITDAGHEIKTPLTIIKADADILEMDLGENEWLDDIAKQTARLAELTNNLIYLAKTEEPSDSSQMIEFPLSDVVEEVAVSFQGPAKAKKKQFTMKIQPMLSMTGDEKKIGQLTGILLDNAVKYSPDNGSVSLTLEKQNKNIVLTVFNDTENDVSKENLSRMFDRFYRMDESRNSKTGGYGIGLSMAKAIAEAHGGKIQATTKDGKSLQVTVIF